MTSFADRKFDNNTLRLLPPSFRLLVRMHKKKFASIEGVEFEKIESKSFDEVPELKGLIRVFAHYEKSGYEDLDVNGLIKAVKGLKVVKEIPLSDRKKFYYLFDQCAKSNVNVVSFQKEFTELSNMVEDRINSSTFIQDKAEDK